MDDRDLRTLLRAAHDEDRPPAFDATWRDAEAAAATRRRRAPWRFAAGGVAVAALAALALWWWLPRGGGTDGAPIAGGEQPTVDAGVADVGAVLGELPASVAAMDDWQAPTDFLLDTPGADYWSSTPELGTSDLPLPAGGEKGL